MKRTPHYTCRHSCNCDGRVRAYLPVQICRASWLPNIIAVYMCLHLVSILFFFSFFLVYLAVFFVSSPCLDLHRRLSVQNPVLSATGNGRPDMGVMYGAVLKATRNYTFLFAMILIDPDRPEPASRLALRFHEDAPIVRIIFKIDDSRLSSHRRTYNE